MDASIINMDFNYHDNQKIIINMYFKLKLNDIY